MHAKFCGLYVIIDPDACRLDPIEVAGLALAGGARVLQWRDKRREKGDQLDEARAIRALCVKRGAVFIVNDHVDLALAIGADGVHLGQHDLPAEAVRPLVPPEFIVGVSTNDVEEARRAQAAGASYVAVGAIYPTGSKSPERTRPASLEQLREVKSAVDLPLVAIGGINDLNIDQVLAVGADAVAVISAVCAADDPRDAARRLAARFGGK